MIEYLEHHIVDHCNLNCVGCSHFSPLADQWFENLEDFKKDFSKLASMTEVGTSRLMGGEPLLHPQVTEFIKIARELFPNTDLQLVTNGLLLSKRKDEIMDLCNDLHVTICVSDYHIIDLKKALEGFKYTRVDYKARLYNVCLDPFGSRNNIDSFNHCDLHIFHWYYFQGGRFYPCCIFANIQHFNKYFKKELEESDISEFMTLRTPEKDEISISIHEHTIEEVEQFLNIPKEVCKYCDTIQRQKAYKDFCVSKREMLEWICP